MIGTRAQRKARTDTSSTTVRQYAVQDLNVVILWFGRVQAEEVTSLRFLGPRTDVPVVPCTIIAGDARPRHPRPAAAQPAPVGDRPLQPPVPLLHAGGRVPLAAARGRADVRGDRAAGGSASPKSASTGCGSPAASRCCAATSRSSSRLLASRAVGARSGAHDQRRPARRRGRRPASSAGLHRLTVSLDTLRARSVSAADAHRRASPQVLAGIDAARRAGFTGLKLDTVITRGDNDDELVDLLEFAPRSRRRSAVHRVHGRRRRHAVAARGRRLARRDARAPRRATTAPIAPIDEPIVGARPRGSGCRTA